VAIGGSSEAKARALAAFEEHAGEYRRGQQDAERLRRCVPPPGGARVRESMGRDETRPVSTGGRDETCPVSTGGGGSLETWALETWRDHFENDVLLAALPPLALFLRET